MQVIIGLDIGTTSTKAVAFNLAGKVICADYQGYPILNPQPNFSEQNPEEVFTAVLKTMREVVTRLGNHEITGVSFSSAMHSLIAVDSLGQPLTNCLIWADNRSEAEADTLKSSPAGPEIYHHTGTPIHPMSPLCKLMWMQQHQPFIHQQAHKFISIKEFVLYKFFGKYIIDYSIASATGLFDIRALTWYMPALDLTGISPEKLSQPVSPYHQEFNLLPEYAAFIGIKKMVPFIIGASDGCLANLGAQTTKPGVAALTIGTSGAIRVTAPQPATDTHQRLFNYILTPNQYIVGGAVNNGGIILRWFRDTFCQDIKQVAQRQNREAYDLIIEAAATVPAGANGLLFLPYLLGERAPHWNAQARGVFFGMTITHTQAHFARAVMEGILFNIYQVAQALEQTTGPVTAIYASGGFAHSEFWVQLLADIFNKKVYLTETIESSAWGAALLGLEALGLAPADPEQTNSRQEYLPDAAKHAVYLQNFNIFDQLYPVLKSQMKQVSNLQKTPEI